MLTTTPLEIRDFSGGITDNITDSPTNKCQRCNNLLITENRKLSTRDGSEVLFDSYPQIPMGNQRVGTLLEFTEVLVAQTGAKFYYDSGSDWSSITAPNTGDPLNDIDVDSTVTTTIWNDQLYIGSDQYSRVHKIFKDDVGVWNCSTAGMPALANTPIVVSQTPQPDSNFIYAFYYSYEYKVGTVTYIDAGPVVYWQALGFSPINENDPLSFMTVLNIPILANGPNDNYDIANIKVQIYRTVQNGDALHYVDTIDNGVPSYVDENEDEDISQNATIYTSGGVQNNDPPPRAKAVHIVGDVCYYGNIQSDSGETRSNKYMLSVEGDPDSVPALNFGTIDDEIVAITSYMDRAIILCKRSTYRSDGTFGVDGSGILSESKISDHIGCVSLKSVVQTEFGVFFASREGFAYTDGFKCFLISGDFKKTYKTLTQNDEQKRRIYGCFQKSENRVWWSVQKETGGTSDIDVHYIADLRWGISENMSFTTTDGLNDSYNPTACIFVNDNLVRADRTGYLFVHRDGLLNDPRIDLSIPHADWGQNALVFDFISVAIRPDAKTRSFVPKMIISTENPSNLSLQVVSLSDIGNRVRYLKPIRWRGNFVWGDHLFSWNESEFVWGEQGFIEQQRYFSSDDLRCTYKQVQLTNANVEILNSDAFSTATINNIAKTVTLDDSNFNWLDDMKDYKIYLEDDDYEKGYEIVSNSALTLVVADEGNTLPNGSRKWQIKGIPKDEVLSLLTVVLMFAPLGQTQDRFEPSSLGGNS